MPPRCGFQLDGETCAKRGAHYCVPRAGLAVAFFRECLQHTKGRWARSPFRPTGWQRRDILRPLFGQVVWSPEKDRYIRRYRVGWIELPRKNGKSELLAGIGLLLLVADGEEGAEVYSCARDRDQARKVWDVAARMVELSPTLSRRLQVRRHERRIVDPVSASWYEVVAADAAGNLGHNPHGVIFDEVLAQPDDRLWNAFRTAMTARDQPLMVAATTAGDDPVGFCAAEHAYCERVSRSPRLDPRRFVYLRTAPADREWDDEEGWWQANPALGEFKSIEAMREEAREVTLAPRKRKAFEQFELNRWVQVASAWLDLEAWDSTAGLVSEAELRGRPCWGGLDLASSRDIAALCWTFRDDPDPDLEGAEPGYVALWRCFAPEAQRRALDERTGGQATEWARAGFLTFTEGNVIDYRAILAQLDRDAQAFDVAEVGYDRWGMTQLAQDLADAGMAVIPFSQGFAAMSPPTKELERVVLGGRYRHGGNPVLRWMVDSAVARTDPAGNVKLDKARSKDKIDGLIAAVMALDRAMRHAQPARSAYEDGHVEVV